MVKNKTPLIGVFCVEKRIPILLSLKEWSSDPRGEMGLSSRTLGSLRGRCHRWDFGSGFYPAIASVVKWISRQASNLKLGVRIPPEAQGQFAGRTSRWENTSKASEVVYEVKISLRTHLDLLCSLSTSSASRARSCRCSTPASAHSSVGRAALS